MAGIGDEADDRLADLLDGERRAGRLQVAVDIGALPGGVGGDAGLAQRGCGG